MNIAEQVSVEKSVEYSGHIPRVANLSHMADLFLSLLRILYTNLKVVFLTFVFNS